MFNQQGQIDPAKAKQVMDSASGQVWQGIVAKKMNWTPEQMQQAQQMMSDPMKAMTYAAQNMKPEERAQLLSGILGVPPEKVQGLLGMISNGGGGAMGM